MSAILKLEVVGREATGKGPARTLRREGNIPAIIYGGKEGELKISANLRELQKVIALGNFKGRVLDIQLGKETIRVLPRDVQLHPVTDVPEHVDFLRIDPKSKVHVEVKVEFLNKDKSPGLKRGGVLNVVRRKLELICPADAIPQKLEIDLAGTQIGDAIHYSSLTVPAGVEPVIKDRDFTVATIVGRVMKTEAEEIAEAAAKQAAAAEAQKAGS